MYDDIIIIAAKEEHVIKVKILKQAECPVCTKDRAHDFNWRNRVVFLYCKWLAGN